MKPVFCIASNVSAPPGLTTDMAWQAVQAGESGVRLIRDASLFGRDLWASRFHASQWETMNAAVPDPELSPLERMATYSILEALSFCAEDIHLSRTLLVFCSTKGNIEWLGMQPDVRNRLTTSAAHIAKQIGIDTKPLVMSHACVSGVTGLIYALHALQSGRFESAIVCGADRISRFVISGFASFQALADERCRPFDAARKGINLGEAAATIILSTAPRKAPWARLSGGATSNDANHISGPSRTGEELSQAISQALDAAGVTPEDIGAISAHGTATLYNDEMESKAFAHAGLLHAPVHSLKGYFGHTLGAAGILESAMLIDSMLREESIASAGFETLGVSEPVIIARQSGAPMTIRHALKTASGFGGCNAAVVWSAVNHEL